MKLLVVLLAVVGLLVASPTPSTDAKLDAQMNDALFKLSLHALKTKANEPTIVSPFSVAMALATVNLGAKEKTSQEITDIAFGGISKDQVTSWFKTKLAQLKREYSPLSIASAIYIEKTMKVVEQYLTDVKDNFQSKVESVDFMHEPKTQRTLINNFVNESTAGHIPELLGDGHVTPDIRLIAVNALYMKSAFDDEFPASRTKKLAFNNEDKSTKQLDTMNGTHDGRFFENDEFVYGDLPFKEDNFKFFLIVPKSHPLAAIKDKFIAANHKFSVSHSGAKNYMYLHVTMPKFNVSTDLEFKDILKGLGINEVFQKTGANLKGISAEQLFVEYIVHKAVVEVDEKGVTAAAATGVGIMLLSGRMCMEDCHKTIDANKPFMYGIAHRGTPIFVGHYY